MNNDDSQTISKGKSMTDFSMLGKKIMNMVLIEE
jgi:hypothetical protein